MSKVLTKEIDRIIKYYEKLKKEANEENLKEIYLYVYDKMSFLINQFDKNIDATEINNIKEYLNFSLNLDKDEKSLLIDIQGRFVKTTSDINTKTYKILSDIIKNKENLILTLEKIIN